MSDLAIRPELTLEVAAQDLFEKFEKNYIPGSRGEVVNEYFRQMAKADEMAARIVDPAYYEGLQKIVKQQVLPAYDSYRQRKAEIKHNSENRKPGADVWDFETRIETRHDIPAHCRYLSV